MGVGIDKLLPMTERDYALVSNSVLMLKQRL